MNLLSDLFNDEIKIVSLNIKYIVFSLVILVLAVVLLLIIKVNYYYQSTFSVIDGNYMLLVDNEYINKIKDCRKILIKEIKCDYSINSITPINDNYLVAINLKTTINNISNGTYKINLGKERLFNYIIRIIKE